MKIFLIRHGQTTGEAEGRYGGAYEDHLSKDGLLQAQELAEKLKGSGIEIVFCSPMIRVQETLVFLQKQLGCSAEIDNDLRERDQFAQLSGRLKAEVREKSPELAKIADDYRQTLPGAESYPECWQRVALSWQRLLNRDYQTIAILTHGGPIRAIFREVLKLGEIEYGNCSFAVFEKEQDQVKLIRLEGIAFENS
jgi:broad specificity phosphatase PhoE